MLRENPFLCSGIVWNIISCQAQREILKQQFSMHAALIDEGKFAIVEDYRKIYIWKM